MPQPLMFTFQGRTQSLWSWAKEVGLRHGCIQSRLRYGWSIENALTLPVSNKKGRPRRWKREEDSPRFASKDREHARFIAAELARYLDKRLGLSYRCVMARNPSSPPTSTGEHS